MQGAKNNKYSDELIIATAKRRFKVGHDADSENRAKALEDMDFRAGEQWPTEIKKQRELDARPCLVVNKIPQNVHQITNDQRQNRPAIKVSPVDNGADPETAKVLQGIIRNIENVSNADTAYDVAFDAAVTGGRGYFRMVTEYASPESFDQEIRIKQIQNPHSVVLDPSYKEPDGSDANWAFVFEDIPKDDFKRLYPNARCSGQGFEWSIDEHWFHEDEVRIAEYFERRLVPDTLYQLPDGSTVLRSVIDELSPEDALRMGINIEQIEGLPKRKTQVPKVDWYKINGDEVLEKTEWPGSWIPVFPVHGEELYVRGKRVFEGIIRHAKDPQRMYNYWASCETEAIALAPKAPFIGAEGQFEGHENKWETSHLKNYAYLEYKPTTLPNKQAAPPPQRNFSEPAVQAVTQARMLASDDLKSTTGIYDASLGNRSNESSGLAIRNRAQQSQVGNFHFIDNLSRSIRHLGKCLIEVIPKIYDTQRVVRIIGPDDAEDLVVINAMFQDKDGKEREHDLSVGKYDAMVSTGPNYATKRQEAVESMLDLSRHNQQVANVAGDLLVKNMDWPGAEEIAERIKKTIPPEILEEGDPEIPPELKAQIDQMAAMIDDLTSKLNDAQDEIDQKKIELESKERIEFAKIDADLRIKSAELQAKENATPADLKLLKEAIFELDERLLVLDQMIQGQPPAIPQEDPPPLSPELIPNQDFSNLADQDEAAVLNQIEDENLTGEEAPGFNTGQDPREGF